MLHHKKILYCVLFLLLFHFSTAQNKNDIAFNHTLNSIQDSSAKIHVKDIIIKGNKKTKDYIILREIQFKAGDSIIISKLNTELEQARQQVS